LRKTERKEEGESTKVRIGEMRFKRAGISTLRVSVDSDESVYRTRRGGKM